MMSEWNSKYESRDELIHLRSTGSTQGAIKVLICDIPNNFVPSVHDPRILQSDIFIRIFRDEFQILKHRGK